MQIQSRSQDLDFLRGIAVILVLFRHHYLFDFTKKAGWIGVDLFFVLSGFLVSGLLFSEYKKFGNIRPFYFLIRRGFKIYPLFYFSLALTFVLITVLDLDTLNYKGRLLKFLPEIFFLQNYLPLIWDHHWSLAVEEHFYIFLALLIFVLVKTSLIANQLAFYLIAVLIFAGCLGMRLYFNLNYPENMYFFQTHLRIDSLFAGVLVAYFYHFNKESLEKFTVNNKYTFLLISLLPVFFTPFIEPETSFFMKTFGFSILYISFSFLLLTFLFNKHFVGIFRKIITDKIYSLTAYIGIYSYGIYLFHLYLTRFVLPETYTRSTDFNGVVLISFILYVGLSLIIGIVLSKFIEESFLNMRDQYFPRRGKQ